ncbi:MAG: HAD hydrolase family protein [Candidatus Zixiibacteriota bacterium]|nr:MAG: HAD hydrolase family protein [candidate division Zixibacteria bacterium]
MSKLTRHQLLDRLKNIQLLALDVDGVLTDDSIYFGPDGFELKRFNISDGLFMVLALRSGLELAIVSGRYSPATDTRMRDLGIKHVLQGMKDKAEMLQPLLEELNLTLENIAFVGNEILDIDLVTRAGVGVAVADSAPELIEVADYITSLGGGKGAVREIIECYFEARNIDPRGLLV